METPVRTFLEACRWSCASSWLLLFRVVCRFLSVHTLVNAVLSGSTETAVLSAPHPVL